MSALAPSISFAVASGSMARSYGSKMRQASRRSGQLSDECRTEVAQNIIDFLRRAYPVNTAINVAADTGVSAETVQKQIDRVSMPSAFNFMRYGAAYGPEFLAAAYPTQLGWLSDAAREAARRKLDAEIAALEARRAKL